MEDTFYNSLKQNFTNYHLFESEKAKEITDSCPINTINEWTGKEMFTYLEKKFVNHVKITGQNNLTIQLFGESGFVDEHDRFLMSAFGEFGDFGNIVKNWLDFCNWYTDSIREINISSFKDKTFLKDKLKEQVEKSLKLIKDTWKLRHPLIDMDISYKKGYYPSYNKYNYSLTLSFNP